MGGSSDPPLDPSLPNLTTGPTRPPQAYTARFLNELCADFVLELSATKPAVGSGGAGGGGREKEEINKVSCCM